MGIRYVVKQVAENIYDVDRVTGWWFWRKTYTAQAYWHAGELGLGSWHWVEDDEEILDPDVRIALCEAHNKWLREKEMRVWKAR